MGKALAFGHIIQAMHYFWHPDTVAVLMFTGVQRCMPEMESWRNPRAHWRETT